MQSSSITTLIWMTLKLISAASEDVSNGDVICVLRTTAEWLGKNMTLSWSLPETSKNMSVRLQWHYVGLSNQVTWICPNNTPNTCPEMRLTSITWDSSNGFDLTTNLEATIEVIDSSDGKTMFKSTGNYDPDECYKPPAVETLKVEKVTNTSITLSWGYKHSLYKVCRLNHTSEWTGEEESVLLTDKEARNSTFTAYNLTAFTNYSVTVECARLNYRDRRVGYWSDAIQLTVKTHEGLPSVSPAMTEGGYSTDDHLCPSTAQRQVTVFWKKLHPKNSHGVILDYRLDITTDSSSNSSTRIIGSDVISTVLELLCDQMYVLKLRARTQIGFSILPSILVISSVTNNVFPRVSYVVPEYTENERIMQITWVMDGSEPSVGFNVTVFWCLGNQLSRCKTDGYVEWINANDTQTPVTIRLPEDKAPNEFMFGVITVSSSITTGIIWHQCLFQKDADITQPPDNVKLMAFGLEGSLYVTWDSIPCATRVYIKYYRITFCEVTYDTGNCTEPSRDITVDGQQTSYRIVGLDTKLLYGVRLSAGCSKGDGPKSDMVIGKPVSGNSSLNSFPILEVSLGCACAMLCFCIGFCLYCKVKKYIKKRRRQHNADVSYVRVAWTWNS